MTAGTPIPRDPMKAIVDAVPDCVQRELDAWMRSGHITQDIADDIVSAVRADMTIRWAMVTSAMAAHMQKLQKGL